LETEKTLSGFYCLQRFTGIKPGMFEFDHWLAIIK